MELSLHVSNRLRIYLDGFARLKPSPASNEFRKDLIDLHAHILGIRLLTLRVIPSVPMGSIPDDLSFLTRSVLHELFPSALTFT